MLKPWLIRAIEEMFYLDEFSLDRIKGELAHYHGIDLSIIEIGGVVNSAFDDLEELCA